MSEFSQDFRVTMRNIRCWSCKKYYSVELGENVKCPYCTVDTVRKLEERQASLFRSISALRGAVTKAKAR